MPPTTLGEFRERAEHMTNAAMQQVRSLASRSRNYAQQRITALNERLRGSNSDDQNWSTTTSERNLSRGSSKDWIGVKN
mgnify:FL=1